MRKRDYNGMMSHDIIYLEVVVPNTRLKVFPEALEGGAG